MKEIKVYKQPDGTYNADVLISVDEWKEILLKGNLITETCRDALIKFYKESNHRATCSELGEKYNIDLSYFKSSITAFGQQVKKELNRFSVVRENGQETFWIIPMTGHPVDNNKFEWEIRPELVQAMEATSFIEDKTWEYHRFKKLLEYFVAHLEFCVTGSKDSKGYHDYLKDIDSFRRSGQGHKGQRIQNQIKSWEFYTNGRIFININASTFTGKGTYLNWENTAINVNTVWDESEKRITQLKLMKDSFPLSNAKQVLTMDVDELGILDGKEPNEHLRQFFDKFNELKINLDKKSKINSMKDLMDLLTTNKNLILTGAPGTGKTFLAKQMAQLMVFGTIKPEKEWTEEEKEIFNNRFRFVQFHPSYDYTDFVEGLRPTAPDNNGNIGFELKNGVFKEFCQRAKSSNQPESQDNFDDTWTALIDRVRENIAEGQLTKIGKWQFGLSSQDSLKYSSTNTASQYTFTLTKDNILAAYQGRKARPSGGYQKEMEDVVQYLKDNFGLKAYKQNSSQYEFEKCEPFVFIIDEINRGEISKIFGELFFAIDPGYRGKKGKVQTQYANIQSEDTVFDPEEGVGWFYVPENVYIIGTMNDIDRSVESMDFAIRRRFAWKEIKSSERLTMLEEELDKQWVAEAKNRLNRLNMAIENTPGLNSAYHIGPAYFLKLKEYDGDFNKLWDFHLKGILTEYLRGILDASDLLAELQNKYDGVVDPNEEE